MKKWVLLLVLLAFTGGAWAEDAPSAPAKSTTTVGGGVNNPWRSPYRIALTVAHPADAR